MWDEQERFARIVARIAVGALVLIFVGLAGTAAFTGETAFLWVLLSFFGALAGIVFVWVLATGSLVAMLAGIMKFLAYVQGRAKRHHHGGAK